MNGLGFSQTKQKIKMMNKLEKLLAEHRLSASDCFHQLNELTGIDKSKFSAKEVKDIDDSINELEIELSMRRLFISELETLL